MYLNMEAPVQVKLNLELRLLTLLDACVGFAINALQDAEEASVAVKEFDVLVSLVFYIGTSYLCLFHFGSKDFQS